MTPNTSSALPDIDFRLIRPYGSPPSRADAFEELASTLVCNGLIDWPDGTVFDRFGNPDGGREGRGLLPNGDVWAWQAKYLFAFGDSEIAQVHKSVMRTLETEPDLKRYYVALPYDLPSGDTFGSKPRKSAHTKWVEKQAEWRDEAAARGMDVEFVYTGLHALVRELTKPEHAGRVSYWFNAAVLSPDAMKRRLADVIAKVGRRYSPEVHVEVDAVAALDGLGRTDEFVRRAQIALAEFRKVRRLRWLPPHGDEVAFEGGLAAFRGAWLEAEMALERYLEAAKGFGELPDIVGDLRPIDAPLEDVYALLRRRHLKDGRYYLDQAGDLFSVVTKAREALWNTVQLLNSPAAESAAGGRLLMTGRAGVGKTHLFCDVASRRINDGAPTLLVLGQDFDASNLLAQIGQLVGIYGDIADVLDVLDAAGEAAHKPTMLMLDAINEGAEPERWSDELRVLAGAVARYPNVVLAISCRTEFVEHVAGDDHGFPTVEHYGFAEATSEAIDRFTTEYNLERLTFPALNPEFGNPLFLKLACEALATLGDSQFTLGTAGLTTVCDAFMTAVNKRLAAPGRCDYDEKSNLVQRCASQLARSGPGPYDHDEVKRITESLLPGRFWSQSLLLGLLREGVLISTYDNRIAFGYQRLGDVLRAHDLSERSDADLSSWYDSVGNESWRERGTLGALAVLAPERLGVEIIDMFMDSDNRVGYDVIDAFVESLALRAPAQTTARTAEIVDQLVDNPTWANQLLEMLVRVACTPGHSVNAEWTHRYLNAIALPDRDTHWSEWLIAKADGAQGHSVQMLLDWSWNPVKYREETEPLPIEVTELATLMLGWMLTTPDRRVRDRATKGLVSIGGRAPTGFAQGLRRFRNCDDPYVIERLSAAACAITLRSKEPDVAREVANAAVELVADGWPVHLLTRDYLRRTAQAAHKHGWEGPEWKPPYGSRWPVRARSAKAITAMTEAPDYAYSSIWSSLTGTLGDFGHYVLRPALEHFDTELKKLQSIASRAIFTRAVDLGWTPERFDTLERGRRGGYDGHIERYGKKYQWIGLYETLGRIADNYQLKEQWSDSDPFDYEYAEQLVYRDIDPTVLRPGGMGDVDDDSLVWFAPVAATFPTTPVTGYPDTLDGVPDPLDLIALTDPDGEEWLSLIRHGSWTQTFPPEIAAFNAPYLHVWMQIRGYLMPSRTADALQAWAEDKDWDGRWMPDNAEVHNRLLAAHPDSPDWDWADGHAEMRGFREEALPTTLSHPVAFYGGTGESRESAGTAEPTGFVPTRLLFDTLGLKRSGDFCWNDEDGPALVDPTVGMDETSTIALRRSATDRIAKAGYSLFWTVLSYKQRNDNRVLGRPGPRYRWITASASYLLKDQDVERISAHALRRRPYPGGDPDPIDWEIRRVG